MTNLVYGNVSLEIINEYKYLSQLFSEFNYDKNFFLDYKEPTKQDVIDLYNLYNKYSSEDKIKIANLYDDPIKLYMNRYYKNNPNLTSNNIKDYVIYIKNIMNYYVLKYKFKFNAARPYQIANKYNIKLYPVELKSTFTPSYPSGHAILYYALNKFFNNIDKYNNYDDILHEGLKSRIISGIHFEQDNEASIKLCNYIINNNNNLKLLY